MRRKATHTLKKANSSYSSVGLYLNLYWANKAHRFCKHAESACCTYTRIVPYSSVGLYLNLYWANKAHRFCKHAVSACCINTRIE